MLFFVWLLTCVLPFICWGEWAQPGHAHGGPHVVFAPPPEHVHPHQHPIGDTHATDPAGPIGQARPDTSLVITALLIVGSTMIWRIALQSSSRRLPLHLRPLAWFPAVPSPPPRPVA